jgi:CheY-like chemotaxis protein
MTHPISNGPYQLLVVEDEPQVRLVTERTLQHFGHRVTSVPNIASAMALLEAGTTPDVVISDVMMAGGTGIDLVAQMRGAGIRTPVLLVSGFALDPLDAALHNDPAVGFLAKPWDLDALMASIEDVRHKASS